MKAPIIFLHFGDSWYLKHTLKCAKAFNPDTDIFLFGDDSNKDISIQSGVIFDYYENYDGKRSNFEDLKNSYNHIGSAPKWAHSKHHFNIMRWLRLRGKYDKRYNSNIRTNKKFTLGRATKATNRINK